VWLFSTVVTTSLRVLDCDQGLEGRLIMDPTLACPLANPTKHPDADPAPAVLGIIMLGIYALGILAFLGVAIKLAFKSARKRSLEYIKMKKTLRLKKKRDRKKKKRQKALRMKKNDVEVFGEKLKPDEKAAIDRKFAKDQIKRKVCCRCYVLLQLIM
jgi:hypothetical protein